jgi:hypothetical protein
LGSTSAEVRRIVVSPDGTTNIDSAPPGLATATSATPPQGLRAGPVGGVRPRRPNAGTSTG